MKLSQRSSVDLAPSRLASAIESARERRSVVIDLTLSNPTRAGLSYAAYAPSSRFDVVGLAGSRGANAGEIEYAPDPLGLPSAREAVARHWTGTEPPRAEHVLLLPSSSEAYHYLFMLLCDEGDAVLAPEPSYPLLSHLARYAGVRLEPYRLAYDGAWHIDMDSVQRARSSRTRAIVLISPNNPTGSFTTLGELQALARLGLPLISDEVFARYAFDASALRSVSALHATDALTFCIDGLSKSAGLPQVKLSWVAASGPPALLGECFERLAWLADTYLSVSTPIQRTLPALLEQSADFRAPLQRRLRENRQILTECLTATAASVLHAEGGWYAVIRLPNVATEEDWVLALLEGHGVLTHPGHFYDFDGDRPHLVTSLLVPEAEFRAGARAIRREVDARAPALGPLA